MHPLHAEECELAGKDVEEEEYYCDDWDSLMGCYCAGDYSWLIVWEQEKRQEMAFTKNWQSLILHDNKS